MSENPGTGSPFGFQDDDSTIILPAPSASTKNTSYNTSGHLGDIDWGDDDVGETPSSDGNGETSVSPAQGTIEQSQGFVRGASHQGHQWSGAIASGQERYPDSADFRSPQGGFAPAPELASEPAPEPAPEPELTTGHWQQGSHPASEPQYEPNHMDNRTSSGMPRIAAIIVGVIAVCIAAWAIISNSSVTTPPDSSSQAASASSQAASADASSGAEAAAGSDASSSEEAAAGSDASSNEEATSDSASAGAASSSSSDSEAQAGTLSVEAKQSLGEYTWEELSAISTEISQASSKSDALKTAEKYGLKIGDTKSFALSDGSSVSVTLADVWHDQKLDGQKAGLTFLFDQCIGAGRMNPKKVGNDGGWRDSELRGKLNSEYMNKLPDDLQESIVKVVKYTNNVGETTDAKGSISSTEDALWLPSVKEICGDTQFVQDPVISNDIINAETGEQYKMFADYGLVFEFDESYDLLLRSNDDGEGWWFRTPSPGTDDNYRSVTTDGIPSQASLAQNTHGICPGFCI